MSESQVLRKVGLRVTSPRIKILQVLRHKMGHLSAEDVYKTLIGMGEDIGLATIYRVLTQFEAAGLAVRHNFDGEHSVFEWDQGGHHDHMICVDTGDIIEFVNEDIERLQKKVVEEHNYELVGHNLVLYVRPLKKKD